MQLGHSCKCGEVHWPRHVWPYQNCEGVIECSLFFIMRNYLELYFCILLGMGVFITHVHGGLRTRKFFVSGAQRIERPYKNITVSSRVECSRLCARSGVCAAFSTTQLSAVKKSFECRLASGGNGWTNDSFSRLYLGRMRIVAEFFFFFFIQFDFKCSNALKKKIVWQWQLNSISFSIYPYAGYYYIGPQIDHPWQYF